MAEILKNNSFMALPSSIKRGNPAPLDVTEIWFSYAEMADYAANNATAYVGQQMALVDENEKTAKAYIILNTDGDLQEIGAGVLTDDLSVEINDEGAIALYGFGTQYYRFVEAVGDEPAHYELQTVDAEHPWSAGLEPRVVTEEGKLVLGWFEPNPTTVDGVQDQVTAVQGTVAGLEQTTETLKTDVDKVEESVTNLETSVEELEDKIGDPANSELGTEASGLYAELETKANAEDVYTKTEVDGLVDGIEAEVEKKANSADVYTKTEADGLLNAKANSADVYTKDETDGLIDGVNTEIAKKANSADVYTIAQADAAISAAVAGADHLKRKIMGSLEEVEAYAATNEDATQYIFMVSNGLTADANRYYEYMVFEVTDDGGAVSRIVEKVGNWEVDLSGYATVGALNTLTQTVADNKTSIEEALAEEVNRAKKAEEANAGAISHAQTTADNATQAVIDEANTARAAEQANAQAAATAQTTAENAQKAADDEKNRAELAEKALSDRIDAIDFVDNDELNSALEPYAKTADVNTTLADYAKTADVNTALDGKADKATTLSGYGITDAYTKAETDKAIADKVADVTGGESAAAVKLLLEAEITRSTGKDNAHDTAINSITEKLNSISSGAQVNVIDAVNEAEFTLEDKLLGIREVSANKISGLEQHSALTSLRELITNNTNEIANVKSSVSNISDRLNSFVLKTVYEAEIAEIKEAITWHEV